MAGSGLPFLAGAREDLQGTGQVRRVDHLAVTQIDPNVCHVPFVSAEDHTSPARRSPAIRRGPAL